MINIVSKLSDKIEELETQLDLIKNSASTEELSSTTVCINRNFSNLEIILPKKILLTKISLTGNSNLFFQGEVTLNLPTEEETEISLLAGNTIINKQTKLLQTGSNKISIFCNFSPILPDNMSIYLKITPKNQKVIYLQDVSIFIWGILKEEATQKYQALELSDKYLLSFSSAGSLYYKLASKEVNEYSLEDFEILDSVLSFSFAVNEESNEIFLFKIIDNGDLFFNKLNEKENYILSGVDDVSAVFSQGVFYVFYVKDKKAYSFEMNTSGIISEHKQIELNSSAIKTIYSYFNKTNNKVYVCISDANNSNYLLSQIIENKKVSEHLNVSYKILISTYGELWN